MAYPPSMPDDPFWKLIAEDPEQKKLLQLYDLFEERLSKDPFNDKHAAGVIDCLGRLCQCVDLKRHPAPAVVAAVLRAMAAFSPVPHPRALKLPKVKPVTVTAAFRKTGQSAMQLMDLDVHARARAQSEGCEAGVLELTAHLLVYPPPTKYRSLFHEVCTPQPDHTPKDDSGWLRALTILMNIYSQLPLAGKLFTSPYKDVNVPESYRCPYVYLARRSEATVGLQPLGKVMKGGPFAEVLVNSLASVIVDSPDTGCVTGALGALFRMSMLDKTNFSHTTVQLAAAALGGQFIPRLIRRIGIDNPQQGYMYSAFHLLSVMCVSDIQLVHRFFANYEAINVLVRLFTGTWDAAYGMAFHVFALLFLTTSQGGSQTVELLAHATFPFPEDMSKEHPPIPGCPTPPAHSLTLMQLFGERAAELAVKQESCARAFVDGDGAVRRMLLDCRKKMLAPVAEQLRAWRERLRWGRYPDKLLHDVAIYTERVTKSNEESIVLPCSNSGCEKLFDPLGGSLPNRVTTPFLKCSRCRRARYCSQECQRAHWPQHKVLCKKEEKA